MWLSPPVCAYFFTPLVALRAPRLPARGANTFFVCTLHIPGAYAPGCIMSPFQGSTLGLSPCDYRVHFAFSNPERLSL